MTGVQQCRADIVVIIPDLTVNEELNKPDAALDQSASNQTSPTVRLGYRLIDAIQLQRGFGFLSQIECIRGGNLHSSGEFIRRDACGELRAIRPLALMNSIKPRNQLSLDPRHGEWFIEVRFQIQNGGSRRSKSSSLIERWKIARCPVIDPVHGQALRIVEDNIGGKILILGPQPIGNPRSQRRSADEFASRVNLVQRWFVRQIRREHRSNHRDVVDLSCEVGHRV